jgi:hypothetical protein
MPTHCGLHQLLELAYAPYWSTILDFITNLPLIEGCAQIWVIIDRYTKMMHFIPGKKRTKKVKDLITIFVEKSGDCKAYLPT